MVSGSASVARPASFVHEPWNVVPVVSVVWCWSAVQVIGPLIASAPPAPMVTSDVYQPSAPTVPATISRTAVGGVSSSFTVSGSACGVEPASLVHAPLKSVPVVSSVWCWSAVHATGLLIVSAPVVWMVTSEVYQPCAPSVPAAAGSAAGGAALSTLEIGGASVGRPASAVGEP